MVQLLTDLNKIILDEEARKTSCRGSYITHVVCLPPKCLLKQPHPAVLIRKSRILAPLSCSLKTLWHSLCYCLLLCALALQAHPNSYSKPNITSYSCVHFTLNLHIFGIYILCPWTHPCWDFTPLPALLQLWFCCVFCFAASFQIGGVGMHCCLYKFPPL